LGIGNQIDQSSFQHISFFQNPSEILSLSCGKHFCICVCKNGVFSWGKNKYGQLGIGSKKTKSSPQRIEFFKNPEKIISLSCGFDFSVCICTHGVFSWGNNGFGQLGIGNLDIHFSPQHISFFKNPGKILSLSCGYNFCVCIHKNGVFSWGNNCRGQLGIGNDNNQSSPQRIGFFKNTEDIISLSCGSQFCVCICKNGVFSWGSNYYGQLGIGNHNIKYFPRRIEFFKNPEDIISLFCGSSFCMCICKNEVFIWGENNYGQLGIGNQNNQSSPQKVLFSKKIELFSELSFFRSYIDPTIHIKRLLLTLAREYLNPDECLVGKYYFPLDMFKIILNFIQ
jgi:alpha-tubulin suppressor-like RCC1 family protein